MFTSDNGIGDILTNTPCARGRILRILAADDHEDCVRSLARALELEKFDVCIAFDGSSAISTALAFRPEVVLLDLLMPQVSGIDVARLLRQLPNFDDVVLIALTGCHDAALHQQLRDVGINHILLKPCDFEQLLAILRPLSAGLSRAEPVLQADMNRAGLPIC